MFPLPIQVQETIGLFGHMGKRVYYGNSITIEHRVNLYQCQVAQHINHPLKASSK